MKSAFLITIDTEGDNLWSQPQEITTENSRYLPRFQELCERHRLKPTYLVNYEMACCPVFQEFGKDVIARNAGEIGMHLHAWNSPPIRPLTDDDYRYQPFLTDFPESAMRDKVHALTDLLEDTFDCPIISHRAGRWALNERYARILFERGFRVDCSVTPHLSWRHMKGAPDGKGVRNQWCAALFGPFRQLVPDPFSRSGGPDFRNAPSHAYFLDLDDVTKLGGSDLLEVPVTVRSRPQRLPAACCRSLASRMPFRLAHRAANYFFPEFDWLRPNGRNLQTMLNLVDPGPLDYQLATSNYQLVPSNYLQFMLHSSELMPGGSPTFRTVRSIERLYDHLEQLFAYATRCYRAATLREFYERVATDDQTRQPQETVEANG